MELGWNWGRRLGKRGFKYIEKNWGANACILGNKYVLNLAWVGLVILHPATCNNTLQGGLGKYLFTKVHININRCLRSQYLTDFFLQPTYFPHPKLSSSISHPQSPLPSPPQPP